MWRDSMIGLPLCSVSSRATSSARSIRRSASLRTRRPRSRADSVPHGPFSAARAASTAASTSAASAAATSATTSSVAGLITAIVLPDDEGRHSLLMSRLLLIHGDGRTLPPLELRLALLQVGGRPSFASSLWNSSCCSSRSSARPSRNPPRRRTAPRASCGRPRRWPCAAA